VTRVLIAEDEDRIAAFLQKGLRANGFTTTIVSDGEAAINLARDANYDLLVLDLGLPLRDGQEVLRQIRERGEQMPVIILTARHGVENTIAGLEAGADDYVTKAFVFEEFLARVRARLRTPHITEVTTLEAGPVTLDLRTRQAYVGGRRVALSAREFLLAETFVRHQGEVLSREHLLSRVWGYDFDPGSNIVDVYIGYLRRKLGHSLLETVRSMGYRLRVGPSSGEQL
jgi:DNA-binding response OmpR family regulator